MRGNAPTIRDVDLELEDLVLPVNLLSNETLEESLSPDDVPEEEPQALFNIDACCGTCSARVRVVVQATASGIRHLEILLLSDVSLVCVRCARNQRHGRSH